MGDLNGDLKVGKTMIDGTGKVVDAAFKVDGAFEAFPDLLNDKTANLAALNVSQINKLATIWEDRTKRDLPWN